VFFSGVHSFWRLIRGIGWRVLLVFLPRWIRIPPFLTTFFVQAESSSFWRMRFFVLLFRDVSSVFFCVEGVSTGITVSRAPVAFLMGAAFRGAAVVGSPRHVLWSPSSWCCDFLCGEDFLFFSFPFPRLVPEITTPKLQPFFCALTSVPSRVFKVMGEY